MKHFFNPLRKSIWIVSALCLFTAACRIIGTNTFDDYSIVAALATHLMNGSFGEDAELFIDTAEYLYDQQRRDSAILLFRFSE